jgi:hypothetical protein
MVKKTQGYKSGPVHPCLEFCGTCKGRNLKYFISVTSVLSNNMSFFITVGHQALLYI